MDDQAFAELVESVKQMKAILRGEAQLSRIIIIRTTVVRDTVSVVNDDQPDSENAKGDPAHKSVDC